MSEDFRETYREKFSEIMEDLYEFLNESSLNSWALCADAPYLTGPGHSAAAAPEPPASLSACLFGRATVPIPATLVLSHTQFLLPARLASHQLESQRPRCDLSADSDSVSLATAGGASPVQVHSSNFSPRPSQSPTYSPE